MYCPIPSVHPCPLTSAPFVLSLIKRLSRAAFHIRVPIFRLNPVVFFVSSKASPAPSDPGCMICLCRIEVYNCYQEANGVSKRRKCIIGGGTYFQRHFHFSLPHVRAHSRIQREIKGRRPLSFVAAVLTVVAAPAWSSFQILVLL